MSLYAGDVDVVVPFVFTTAAIVGTQVASVVVRVETGDTTLSWTMTPTATTATSVSCQRVLEAGDTPRAAPGGYAMRAWFYDSGAAWLGTSEEFAGPPVKPSRVSAP